MSTKTLRPRRAQSKPARTIADRHVAACESAEQLASLMRWLEDHDAVELPFVPGGGARDHQSAWRRKSDGERVLISQPYLPAIEGEDLGGDCVGRDDDRSWWWPGRPAFRRA